MYAAGIDVGTTTVCGVLLDAKSGRVERVITLDNDASFPGKRFEDLQDPERIWELAEGIYRDFRRGLSKAFLYWVYRADARNPVREPGGKGSEPAVYLAGRAGKRAVSGRRRRDVSGDDVQAYRISHGLRLWPDHPIFII